MENHGMVYARCFVATSGGMQTSPEAPAAELNRGFSAFGVRLQVLDLQMLQSTQDITELLERRIQ